MAQGGVSLHGGRCLGDPTTEEGDGVWAFQGRKGVSPWRRERGDSHNAGE